MPVEVIGINDTPSPGSKFFVVKSEKDARTILDEQERNKEEEKSSQLGQKMRKTHNFRHKLPAR